jgi:hypothetical protein
MYQMGQAWGKEQGERLVKELEAAGYFKEK